MGKDLSIVNHTVFICNGGTCLKNGAEENTNVLRATITANGIHETTHTIKTKCTGQCEHGPIVFVYPDGIWYRGINLETSESIITEHLLRGEPLHNHILFPSTIDDDLNNGRSSIFSSSNNDVETKI